MADCDKHEKIMTDYEIEGFPTMSLFHNGKRSDYISGRTADQIVNWVTRKLTVKVEVITTHG